VLNGVNLWNRHPISLAAAVAWLELGIGLVLIASRGRGSRIAAAVSVGWGLTVWVGANAMGGIFSTSATFLFGWPGAVVFYVVAGVWLCGPFRWFPEDFSRVTLRAVAALVALAIVVQVWPDHGFWHGGPNNPLRAMTVTMTQSAQPGWLASVVSNMGKAGSALGGGFNLLIVFWLAVSAIGLWRASTRREWWGLAIFTLGCVWIWIVAQDAAVFGGLSTDVNSMIPLLALVWCASPYQRTAAPLHPLFPAQVRHGGRIAFASIGAAMIVMALVPMVRAPLSQAETTLYQAQNGAYRVISPSPAPRFTLTDQRFRSVDFPSAGTYSVLTFLDPKCWTDCPLIAQHLKALAQALTPSERARVRFVAVAANPDHESVLDLRHFIRENGLGSFANFEYVTGRLAAVQAVWRAYGVTVTIHPGDTMSIHSDVVDIIDPQGNVRVVVPDDPVGGGAGTASTVVALLTALHQAGLN